MRARYALISTPADRHPDNSAVFRRRNFITFLAGSERRSKERLKEERARYPIWTLVNACFFAFLLLFFVPALIGLVHIIAFAG